MKYQCNSCGKVHDYRSDAVNCHPDINEIPDEQLEGRLAAQQKREPDVCWRCKKPMSEHRTNRVGHEVCP